MKKKTTPIFIKQDIPSFVPHKFINFFFCFSRTMGVVKSVFCRKNIIIYIFLAYYSAFLYYIFIVLKFPPWFFFPFLLLVFDFPTNLFISLVRKFMMANFMICNLYLLDFPFSNVFCGCVFIMFIQCKVY
jgi:hypothetical protein